MRIQNNFYNSNNKFNPNFEKLGKIVLGDGYFWVSQDEYKNRLKMALEQNPEAVRFFENYDADVYLNAHFKQFNENDPKHPTYHWTRSDMEIRYKHPLYPNRSHIQSGKDSFCPYYYTVDTVKLISDGKDIYESFDNLEKTIKAKYKDPNDNILSHHLIKANNMIQAEIEACRKDKEIYDRLNWFEKLILRLNDYDTYRRIKNYENSKCT